MIIVECPCCSSNNVEFDKDEYDLNTSSCTYFKCNNCGAEFEKFQVEYEEG